MKATCPNCKSDRFITVIHLTEHWLVDSIGDLVDVYESGEVVHGPEAGNTWTCNECGTEANVTKT